MKYEMNMKKPHFVILFKHKVNTMHLSVSLDLQEQNKLFAISFALTDVVTEVFQGLKNHLVSV